MWRWVVLNAQIIDQQACRNKLLVKNIAYPSQNQHYANNDWKPLKCDFRNKTITKAKQLTTTTANIQLRANKKTMESWRGQNSIWISGISKLKLVKHKCTYKALTSQNQSYISRDFLDCQVYANFALSATVLNKINNFAIKKMHHILYFFQKQ